MDEFLFLVSLMVKQTGIRLSCLFLGIYEKLTTFQENYVPHPEPSHTQSAIPWSPTMISESRLKKPVGKGCERGVFQFGVLMANLKHLTWGKFHGIQGQVTWGCGDFGGFWLGNSNPVNLRI